MFPELFTFELPDFLSNIFGQYITIYSYATCIVLGMLIAGGFTKWRTKKELGVKNLSNTFFYLIFIAGFIGGKLFFYLQSPTYYINKPSLLLDNFSGGFVFYGSFVVIIPFIIRYLKKHKIPTLPMLDILAFTTTIIHAIGRFGCFLAGCCYGKKTDSVFGVIFPSTHDVKVHPTQLYEVFVLLTITASLFLIRRKKQFDGQIFLTYLMLYAFGRSVLELLRGDHRGFILENRVSHSQFIAFCLIAISGYLYYKLYTKTKSIKTI
ncbi:MAG: prolipoprotein diacylglyceryl transferase [Cellulophaga sp.]